MAFHFSLETNEMESITAEYGIAPTSFEPLAGGWGNSSFDISTSGDRYILTVFDTLPRARVESLAELLQFLEAHGFPSSRVVSRSKGRFSLEVRGKPVLLKHFVPGTVVPELSTHQLESVGTALARLHLLPPPASVQRGHSFDDEFFRLVVTAEGHRDFSRWIRARRVEFESHLAQHHPPLPAGLCHGDLFYDNLLFDGPQLAAVIDFEEACHHLLIYDLGMAALGLATTAGTFRTEAAAHLLAGYQRVRPLEERERHMLVPSIAYAAAGTACWRYWKYCLDDPSLGLQDRYQEMVEIADSVERTLSTKTFFSD